MPVRTKHNSESRDLYMHYMRGWRDGAARRVFDAGGEFSEKNFEPGNEKQQRGYTAYSDGFSDGQRDGRKAGEYAAKTYSYKPPVIRASETMALDAYSKQPPAGKVKR